MEWSLLAVPCATSTRPKRYPRPMLIQSTPSHYRIPFDNPPRFRVTGLPLGSTVILLSHACVTCAHVFIDRMMLALQTTVPPPTRGFPRRHYSACRVGWNDYRVSRLRHLEGPRASSICSYGVTVMLKRLHIRLFCQRISYELSVLGKNGSAPHFRKCREVVGVQMVTAGLT